MIKDGHICTWETHLQAITYEVFTGTNTGATLGYGVTTFEFSSHKQERKEG